MDEALVFRIATWGVLPAWALLAFAPRWAATQRLVHAIWLPMTLGGVYVAIVATAGPRPEGGSFSSLDGVAALFGDRRILLAGWIHYLAFDLFVGAWMVRDGARHGVIHALVMPCLVLTLLLGPAGLLLYLLVRLATKDVRTLAEGDGTRTRDSFAGAPGSS